MDKNLIYILGVGISTLSKPNILEEMRKYLEESGKGKAESGKKEVKPFVIFTPNPEIVTYAQKDDVFRQIVNTAQINLPDGWGIAWAAKSQNGIHLPRIPGTDFVWNIAKLAEGSAYRIGLIGGRGEVAVNTLECLRKAYPKLRGWAIEGPEVEIQNLKLKSQNSQEDTFIKEIVRKIQREKTDILFVGLGFPKQEYFIDKIKNQKSKIKNSQPLVMMAVGGAFDYISGRVPRAPRLMRRMGLEWLYRLIQEPWRLPRQLKGLEFFWKVYTS